MFHLNLFTYLGVRCTNVLHVIWIAKNINAKLQGVIAKRNRRTILNIANQLGRGEEARSTCALCKDAIEGQDQCL